MCKRSYWCRVILIRMYLHCDALPLKRSLVHSCVQRRLPMLKLLAWYAPRCHNKSEYLCDVFVSFVQRHFGDTAVFIRMEVFLKEFCCLVTYSIALNIIIYFEKYAFPAKTNVNRCFCETLVILNILRLTKFKTCNFAEIVCWFQTNGAHMYIYS